MQYYANSPWSCSTQLVSRTIKSAFLPCRRQSWFVACLRRAVKPCLRASAILSGSLAGRALHQDASCTCCTIRCSRSRQKDIGFSRGGILGTQENKWDENSENIIATRFACWQVGTRPRAIVMILFQGGHCVLSSLLFPSTSALCRLRGVTCNRRSTDYFKQKVNFLLIKVWEQGRALLLMSYVCVAAGF